MSRACARTRAPGWWRRGGGVGGAKVTKGRAFGVFVVTLSVSGRAGAAPHEKRWGARIDDERERARRGCRGWERVWLKQGV